MPYEVAASAGRDSLLARAGRWIIGKIGFGCVLSAIYFTGDHYGWPDALLTIAALLGAPALALLVTYMPVWTRTWTTDAPALDKVIKSAAWIGLTILVISLLISRPATGTCAAALLLVAAGRTFRAQVEPLLRRLRMEDSRPAARTAAPARRHAPTANGVARPPAQRRPQPAPARTR